MNPFAGCASRRNSTEKGSRARRPRRPARREQTEARRRRRRRRPATRARLLALPGQPARVWQGPARPNPERPHSLRRHSLRRAGLASHSRAWPPSRSEKREAMRTGPLRSAANARRQRGRERSGSSRRAAREMRKCATSWGALPSGAELSSEARRAGAREACASKGEKVERPAGPHFGAARSREVGVGVGVGHWGRPPPRRAGGRPSLDEPWTDRSETFASLISEQRGVIHSA
jgi:hypothetical protein